MRVRPRDTVSSKQKIIPASTISVLSCERGQRHNNLLLINYSVIISEYSEKMLFLSFCLVALVALVALCLLAATHATKATKATPIFERKRLTIYNNY